MSQAITANLWFDGNAKEAVDFYVSVFDDGKILSSQNYPDSAEDGVADFQKDMAGKELVIEFEIRGMQFAAINAGPKFKCNESVSFAIT